MLRRDLKLLLGVILVQHRPDAYIMITGITIITITMAIISSIIISY